MTTNKLNIIFNNYFNDYLKLNPLNATYLGMSEYSDKLPNIYSKKYYLKQKEFYMQNLNDINNQTYDTHVEMINIIAFRDLLTMKLEELELPFMELPITQMNNIYLNILALVIEPGFQKLSTTVELSKFRKRMSKIPRLILGMHIKMIKGIQSGRVLPKIIVKQVIIQLENILDNKPYQVCERRMKPKHYRKFITSLNQFFIPCIKKTICFLNKIYLPNARDTMGYCDIPMGKEMYLYLVKKNTTLINLSIPFIHKLGLSETAKVLQQGPSCTRSLCSSKFVRLLQTDSSLHHRPRRV